MHEHNQQTVEITLSFPLMPLLHYSSLRSSFSSFMSQLKILSVIDLHAFSYNQKYYFRKWNKLVTLSSIGRLDPIFLQSDKVWSFLKSTHKRYLGVKHSRSQKPHKRITVYFHHRQTNPSLKIYHNNKQVIKILRESAISPKSTRTVF